MTINLIYAALVLSLLQARDVYGIDRSYSKLLQDITKADKLPNVFVCWSCCWDLETKKHFSRDVGVPITFSKQINNEIDRQAFVFIIDASCDKITDSINKTSTKLFAHPYRWIILQSSRDFRDEILKGITALPDSNIMIVTKTNSSTYELEKYYRVNKTSTIIKEDYGTWDSRKGLTENPQNIRILSKRRRNLQRTTLISSVVLTKNESIYHLHDYKDVHLDTIGKVDYLLVNYILDTLNASRKFNFVNTWGYYNKTTQRFNGMVGQLVDGSANIGGTGLFVVQERIKLIEYLSMITPTQSRFVLRAPSLSYVSNIYALPFSKSLWFYLVILLLLCIISIFIFFKIENFNKGGLPGIGDTRLSDVVLLSFGALCQMGPLIDSRRTSGKIIILFMFIAFLLTYTSYTAKIVALLQSTSMSINSVESLLESKIKIGIEDTPYTRYYFTPSKDPQRKALYEYNMKILKRQPKFMNLQEGVEKFRSGFFTFHMEIGTGYRLVKNTFFEHEKCNLIEINFIKMSDPWLAIEKNSPYKEMIKVNLLKLREHGIQQNENNRFYTKKPVCHGQGQNFQSVSIIDCYVALIIVPCAILISIVFLIIEKVLHNQNYKFCLHI